MANIDATRPHDTQDLCAEQTYYFTTSQLAWAFMREADEVPGYQAGYPSLKPNADGYYTVATRRGGY